MQYTSPYVEWARNDPPHWIGMVTTTTDVLSHTVGILNLCPFLIPYYYAFIEYPTSQYLTIVSLSWQIAIFNFLTLKYYFFAKEVG